MELFEAEMFFDYCYLMHRMNFTFHVTSSEEKVGLQPFPLSWPLSVNRNAIRVTLKKF